MFMHPGQLYSRQGNHLNRHQEEDRYVPECNLLKKHEKKNIFPLTVDMDALNFSEFLLDGNGSDLQLLNRLKVNPHSC